MTVIPPMTDPLSRYWEQPKTEDILVDDTHAVMTHQTFSELKDYSLTQPTGVYSGKMWKAQRTEVIKRDGEMYRIWTGKWILCWFGLHPDPGYVSNNYREILLID